MTFIEILNNEETRRMVEAIEDTQISLRGKEGEELAARRALIHDAALLLQELGIEDLYDHREVDHAVDALDNEEPFDEDAA